MQQIYLSIIIVFFSSCLVSHAQSSYVSEPASRGLQFGAMAGPSLLIEKAPDSLLPEIQDYFNKLRSGWHYGFKTEYFFTNYIGIGAKYTQFNTRQDTDSIAVEFFSSIYYIDLSSEMKIHTLSPMVYGRLPLLKNRLSLTGGIGPAWLFYRNIGKVVGDSAMLKGSSPGFETSLLISFELIPNLAVGLQGNYMYSLLKGFTKDDGTTTQEITLEKENYQNISRIDFSLGIFYTLRRK